MIDTLHLYWRGLRVGRKTFYAFLIALSLAAVVLVLFGTRWGPALGDDSFTYITSARNLVDGLGFGEQSASGSITPLAHYPPLLSLSLAAFEIFGVDAIVGVRWLNATLFGLTVITTGVALHWMTKSYAFALLGASLALLSEVMIGIHVEAMSEALYLWLGLLGLVLLARSGIPRRRSYLLASALLIGAAFLTRYVGLALVAAAVIGLVLDPRLPLRHRLSDAGLFLAVSLAPMAVWGIRNLYAIGNVTDRTAAWYPIGLSFIRWISNVVFIWFIPGRIVHGREPLIALGLFLISLILVVVFLRRGAPERGWTNWGRKARTPSLEVLLILYMMTFLAMYLISKSFFDPAIFPDNRLLSPLHHVMLILLVVILARIWKAGSSVARGMVMGFGIVLVALYGYRAVKTSEYLYTEGLGYTSRQWHGSEAIAMVEKLGGTKIYSNAVRAIYFWTGRTVNYLVGLEGMKQSLEEDCAVLIVFDSIELWLFGTTREEVAEGLRVQERDIADAYYHPQCAEELEEELGI